MCVLVGAWTYIDHHVRYGDMLFANGSAQDGFSTRARNWNWHFYDFDSLRLTDLVELVRGEVPPGHLTDLPFYRSVWTTLHAMAWGDMTMFSDPSRHGLFPDGQPYPRKAINPWLATSVLLLGLLPSGLAIIGFVVSLNKRSFWPLAIVCVLTWSAYLMWFVAQETWALKTKYILFLLPAYVMYTRTWVAVARPAISCGRPRRICLPDRPGHHRASVPSGVRAALGPSLSVAAGASVSVLRSRMLYVAPVCASR